MYHELISLAQMGMTMSPLRNPNASGLRKPPVTESPALILLDRDGVINEDVGAPGVVRPSQLKLSPRAGYAISRLKQAGCSVAILTNQSSVGKESFRRESWIVYRPFYLMNTQAPASIGSISAHLQKSEMIR